MEASKGGESDAKNRVQGPVSQDPTLGRSWGVRGFLESQDKFVGASNCFEQVLSPLDVSPLDAVWDIIWKQSSWVYSQAKMKSS